MVAIRRRRSQPSARASIRVRGRLRTLENPASQYLSLCGLHRNSDRPASRRACRIVADSQPAFSGAWLSE
jgi:hypothetical protein